MRKAAEPLETLPELVTRWCRALGLDVSAKFEPSGDEELFPHRLVLSGADAQWLLPGKGQALDALQFLLHEAQGEREEGRLAYLDVQSFPALPPDRAEGHGRPRRPEGPRDRVLLLQAP